MRTEIIKLHQKLATTFIYVTHDQTEAKTMGDRIVVMKDGIIQQVDTPQHLYDLPCNMFVAGFIGSPQMNFLDATLNKDGNTYWIDPERRQDRSARRKTGRRQAGRLCGQDREGRRAPRRHQGRRGVRGQAQRL